MVVADLLKISCEMLKLLSKYAVKTEDYKHLDLFADYVRMRDLQERQNAQDEKLDQILSKLDDFFAPKKG